MAVPMPVTVPLSYEQYEAARAAGSLDPSSRRCPGCGQADLALLGSTAERPFVAIEVDAHGVRTAVERTIEVAVARCRSCGRRSRVLPGDVPPFKHYSLPLIEALGGTYLEGGQSLRAVA